MLLHNSELHFSCIIPPYMLMNWFISYQPSWIHKLCTCLVIQLTVLLTPEVLEILYHL
uniref:Uncharacterized protein n=1 Tax=Arundo donax TaxID=35708 RepID=A0A0A8ZLE0_ARUDO